MMSREKKNAKIIKTFLGIEDHGIFTCSLTLDYGGVCQGFGNHELKYEKYGVVYLERILQAVGVDKWERLLGRNIRADAEHGKVHGIGHIINDKWFYPEQDLT